MSEQARAAEDGLGPLMAARWARAAPMIEAALVHTGGTHRLEDVAAAVCAGKVQLWLGEGCAAVTEILNYPRKRVLNLWLAGGDLKEMRAMRPGMEAWARAMGCEALTFMGRMTPRAKRLSGWARASGYAAGWAQLAKELK